MKLIVNHRYLHLKYHQYLMGQLIKLMCINMSVVHWL